MPSSMNRALIIQSALQITQFAMERADVELVMWLVRTGNVVFRSPQLFTKSAVKIHNVLKFNTHIVDQITPAFAFPTVTTLIL